MAEKAPAIERYSWCNQSVAREALKHKHRISFKRAASGAYAYALRHEILDDVCAHMKEAPVVRGVWSEENLRKIAEKYSNTRDFARLDSNAYAAASKKGLLEIVCSHMDNFHIERGEPLKKLSKISKRELEEINKTRKHLGAKQLEIKIRTCIHCKIQFESIWDRSCGCSKGHSAFSARLSGYDLV